MSERVPAARTTAASPPATRRRRRGFLRTYLTPKRAIPRRIVLILGVAGFVGIITVWWRVAVLTDNITLVPFPQSVIPAWIDMVQNQGFLADIAWSTFRIVAGFALAALLAVPLGLLMGSFEVVRA